MLQENLFLYHRKPLAFSILSIRSTPGGQRRGVQRKCGLCSFLPFFFFSFPTSLVCGYVARMGMLAGKNPAKPGLLEFTCLLPSCLLPSLDA